MATSPSESGSNRPSGRSASEVRISNSEIVKGDPDRGITVRFAERDDGSFEALEIAACPGSGVFLPLCQLLFEQRVQIVGSRIRAWPGRFRARFDLASETGGPIQRCHGLALQQAIFIALSAVSLAGVAGSRGSDHLPLPALAY